MFLKKVLISRLFVGLPQGQFWVKPSEISETLGLGLDHFPGLGLDLGLENTHFPGLSLEYSSIRVSVSLVEIEPAQSWSGTLKSGLADLKIPF